MLRLAAKVRLAAVLTVAAKPARRGPLVATAGYRLDKKYHPHALVFAPKVAILQAMDGTAVA